mmetsp:Transcript_11336/g.26279  ORF Transcript_11336/g.26279 Transcript_11336/m.26279 type:complete len:461 (-) Transcript_11336:341-1723(-)
MVRDIKADFLLEGINTEESNGPKDNEEGNHSGGDPSNNPENGTDLHQQQVGIRAVVEPADVHVSAVGQQHAVWLCKQTHSNDTPHTVGEVDRDGIHGIVDLEHDQQLGEAVVYPSGDNPNDESSPGRNDRGPGGDSDKSSQGTVHGHGEVIRSFSRFEAFDQRVRKHGRNAPSSGGNGGGHSAKSGNSGDIRITDLECRTGVESVPSEPKNEGSENLKGNGVRRETYGSLQRVSIVVVKASLAGSENDGCHESGGPTSHVHNTGSSEVDNTNITERISKVTTESCEEPIRSPDGMDNNWVDEPGEEDGVAQVGGHLTALRNSSGNNGGGSGGKSKLEEPSNVFASSLEIGESEVIVSDETLVDKVSVSVTIGQRESNRPEANSTTTGIKQVLKHDILDILLTDRSGAEHGETGLHQKHASTLGKTNISESEKSTPHVNLADKTTIHKESHSSEDIREVRT